VLAELAIANAAFAIIKTTLSNGKSLLDVGDDVLDKYFSAEKAINKEVETKGKSTAWEAHEAQFTLRKQQEELKFFLNKREIGGWVNWLKFKADHAREQKELAKLAARKRYARQKAIEENLTHAVKAFGILFVIMAAAFGVAVYWKGWP